ncbi:hypothetical protein BH10PSE17_BH10PSE17_14790 [soil metagenome]
MGFLSVRIPFRLRVFFRGTFLLLAIATLALAISVLREEKELGQHNYQQGLVTTQAQIAARLRHPTGQLALLNPTATNRAPTPLRPVLLPFSAIDFDDRYKAQQAFEMAGCLVQYGGGQTMCVAVGSNPAVGAFVYVAGSFASGELVSHRVGDLDFTTSHRVRITVHTPEQDFGWIAPFEAIDSAATARGRLTGFVDDQAITPTTRPVRDFRGWLWQDGRCADGSVDDGTAACAKRSFLSVRLPIDVWRDSVWRNPQAEWPPAGLDRMQVRIEVLAPGDGPALFDSNNADATPPFSLQDLATQLLPGETLSIRKLGRNGAAREVIKLEASPDRLPATSPWIDGLIRRLPVDGYDAPIVSSDSLDTPVGRYELQITGDLRSVNRSLAAVATRLSWFIAAMLLAIVVCWLAIELRIIRRITELTRRAATVSGGMRAADRLARVDLSDLRGHDELGMLAGGLQDLLTRVNDDVRREHIRAEVEKDQWHAVGHEIVSPLQSLMALHGSPDDPSHRYVSRMQQAIRVLYGSASPSEALQSTTLDLERVDLESFLANVATNAPLEGIDDVRFDGTGGAVRVGADEYALEDVVTHVLRNADRHRTSGTPITMRLRASAGHAEVRLHNHGEPVPDDLIETLFEYGVSGQPDAAAQGSRGQGLFVARTYMAKMGGTIDVRNEDGGVSFVLSLPTLD